MVRFILIILDGLGVGALPDADRYQDEGSNTLRNLSFAVGGLSLPHLERLGLGRIEPFCGQEGRSSAAGCYGKMAEASAGKDTLVGHWEMMGLVSREPFPVYPEGFPPEVILPFQEAVHRQILGNLPASGTEIIQRFGEEHLKSGALIVYTSADSVFQIAAHEEVMPAEELYRICEMARSLLVGRHGVARVIARPFAGRPGSFYRTKGRRDFTLPPPRKMLLDFLCEANLSVVGIGKVQDLFAGRGISESHPTDSNRAAFKEILQGMERGGSGLLIATLTDFDTLFGHRNDPFGFARALQEFDAFLPSLWAAMGNGDILALTADHGCDPTTASTDHSREYVPLLMKGEKLSSGVDLGVRSSFADLGQTIAEAFQIGPLEAGESFWSRIAAEA
ncbi:MAG: phosphopentomutase [candidate division NC10 bacterium]|nr:phosphopentomutase [candidate division NC10 bacterium]